MQYGYAVYALVLVIAFLDQACTSLQPLPPQVRPSSASELIQAGAEVPATPIPKISETPGAAPTADASPTAEPMTGLRPAVLGPAIPVYRGRTDTNSVALTFDAGADLGYASLIIDTLERNGIRASFGMTGQWAEAHQDLVARMVTDGDQLLNHTWDHQSFTGVSTATRPLTRAQRTSQLQRTEDLLLRITGQDVLPYFRAPYGDQDPSVESDAGQIGYRYDILWSVDTGGWSGAPVARIIANSARGAVPGAIIVMHVGAQSQDGPALQGIIDAIRARGLNFLTVAELIEQP